MTKHYKTPNAAERYTSLHVNQGKRAVYSLKLPGLKAGDILLCTGEAEFTSRDTRYNVGVFSQLLLSDAYKGISGLEITEVNGRNITPNTHHDTHTKAGSIVVPSDGDYWLNFVSHALSTSSTRDVNIEKDYGHVSAVVL